MDERTNEWIDGLMNGLGLGMDRRFWDGQGCGTLLSPLDNFFGFVWSFTLFPGFCFLITPCAASLISHIALQTHFSPVNYLYIIETSSLANAKRYLTTFTRLR
jgi:hypothetical protein